MKAMLPLSLVLFASLCAAADPETRPASKPSAPSYRERYGVLGEGNIFIRDRWKPAYRPTIREPRPAGPPPERSYLLTGIVREEETFRAYIEDTAARKILRLAVGDTVARGRISEIDGDGITYEADGQLTWIRIGRDLSGGEIAGVMPAAPTTGPALDPNNPNLTMEERMKLRRMAEMGKPAAPATQPATSPATQPAVPAIQPDILPDMFPDMPPEMPPDAQPPTPPAGEPPIEQPNGQL